MVQPANKRLVTEAAVAGHVATQITTPGSAADVALKGAFLPGTTTGATEGQVATWDATLGKFKPAAPGGGGASDSGVAAFVNTPASDTRAAIAAYTQPLGEGVPRQTVVGTAKVIRVAGDGRDAGGVWEYIHNGQAGYLWHLMQGAASAGGWIFGIGLDGGTGGGMIVRNKAAGIGIKIEMTPTISSATAYGLNVEQKSSVAPAVSLAQRDAGTAPLVEYFSFINDPTDAAVMSRQSGR